MRTATLLCLIAVTLAFAGCSRSVLKTGLPHLKATAIANLATLTYGRQVYRERYCGLCHQLGAAGTHGASAPSHDHIGTTALQRVQDPGYTGEATTAAGYIRESILQPGLYHAPGYEAAKPQMPTFDFLSPQEVDALVLFLVSQR